MPPHSPHAVRWTAALALVLLASLASFALPVAAAGNGNMGTIKVHDEMDADPERKGVGSIVKVERIVDRTGSVIQQA